MAGSVAFQSFLSLLPLLVSLFLLVAVVGGQPLAAEVLALAESFLPEEARRLLANSIDSEITANATSAISVVLLVWGALGLFTALKTAFSTIYRTEATNSFVNQLRDAIAAYAIVLVSVVAAVSATSVSILARVPFVGLVSSVALLLGLVVVFLPLYYLFPDTSISVGQAAPGALLAASGWVLLQALFQLYVRFLADPDVSGALGGILIVLAWLYFGSYVVLFGAVVNYTLAERQ